MSVLHARFICSVSHRHFFLNGLCTPPAEHENSYILSHLFNKTLVSSGSLM